MPGLIVVSAAWCQPCHQLKARLRSAGISFKVVDVDSATGDRLAEKLGVRSIPAVFVTTEDDEYVRVQNPTLSNIRAALKRHE